MEEDKITLINCLEGKYPINEYLKCKAKNHNSYKIYGEENKLKALYEDKKLYLSDGTGWNDIEDRNIFQAANDGYKYYARCFTFSISENVAMWMLYGGMRNQGIMVDVGKANINKIIKGCKEIILGNFDSNKKFIPGENAIIKDDFELYLIDILYYCKSKKSNRCYDVKRSKEEVCVPEESIRTLNRVKKDYAWNYENECRLILKIKKDLCEKYTDALIDFNDMDITAFRIKSSPNYKGKNTYEKSTLNNKMSWNLCNGCNSKNL